MSLSGGTDDLRVGLIGFGLGGACFHAPLIAATPGMRLATVVTANPERRAQVLRDYPLTRVVDRAERLFENAAGHDLVVISTPNRTHVPLALAAIRAAIPVVIDKPMAPTAAEARRVVEAARERGVWISVYHNRRWDNDFLTLRRLLAAQSLGAVLRFESRLERWRPSAKGGWRELGAPAEAGGLLYDLGTHLIDQALVLFGPVSDVYAELDTRRPGIETDDDVFLALRHQSGVRSHLWTSYLAAEGGPRLRVLGDRASFVKMHADPQESALRAGLRPDCKGWGEEPSQEGGILNDGSGRQSVRSEAGAYQQFYASVVGSLVHGKPAPVAAADAIVGLEIIEAARVSAAQRKVVAVA